LVALAAASALAQDRFEIQVYESDTARPGETGIEVHLNTVAAGSTQTSANGQIATTGVTHITFEPHLGVATWCEVGGYLQAAQLPDGTLVTGGGKLRLKLRYPHTVQGFGFAVNFELSDVPKRFEANQWGSEIRPIIDVQWGRWYGSINPILDTDLAGAQAGRPQFQPAAKGAYGLGEGVSVGAEYYGAWSYAPTHALYGALDFANRWLDLNMGVGYGFEGPERWVLKAIIGLHPPPP
jgi:hypothetical protein